MLGYIFLLLVTSCMTKADIVDCSGKVCPAVACSSDARPVYVGQSCCESCVTPLQYGEQCNPALEPLPGGPTGPSGAPRVPTIFPICDVGLQCDEYSLTCV